MGRFFSLTLGTLWGVLAVVLVLFFVGMYFYVTQVADAVIDDTIDEIDDFVETPEEVESDVILSGGGGSGADGGAMGGADEAGGAGGGESSGSTNGGSNCETNQISYGLKNFVKNETCNSFEGENCVDMSYRCSIDVLNLDSNVGGLFGLDFQLKINGETSDSQYVSSDISVGGTETLSAVFQLFDSDAQATLNCAPVAIDIPTKEVCT